MDGKTIMFNLARKRNKVPDSLMDEKAVFEDRIKKPQSLEEDASHLAVTMVRHGLDRGEDGMAEQADVEYWDYVKKFRPKYLRKVFEKAEAIAKQLAEDFKSHPEKFPLPPPPGGPGGGGGGGGMFGSQNKRIVTAENEASVLPNGLVLVRRGTAYYMVVGGKRVCFSSAPEDAAAKAMSIASKGKEGVLGENIQVDN
jgi:hypothetical protein